MDTLSSSPASAPQRGWVGYGCGGGITDSAQRQPREEMRWFHSGNLVIFPLGLQLDKSAFLCWGEVRGPD